MSSVGLEEVETYTLCCQNYIPIYRDSYYIGAVSGVRVATGSMYGKEMMGAGMIRLRGSADSGKGGESDGRVRIWIWDEGIQ